MGDEAYIEVGFRGPVKAVNAAYSDLLQALQKAKISYG